MTALSPVLRSVEGDRLTFWCPGCDEAHVISVAPGRWGYNGNPEKPTFTPSILVQSGHFEEPSGFTPSICHSFVIDGQIRFLSDSTHALAGQTVPLPPFLGGV